MVLIGTKNIRAYCESSFVCLRGFGFAHSFEGLAFIVDWGIVLFGYDT